MLFKKKEIVYKISFDESSNLFIAQDIYDKNHLAFGVTIEEACEKLLN